MMNKNLLISSGDIKVDGFSIHYISAGKGEPILLLHGWPTSSYLWRNIIEPLARTRLVIAPDLPGFGSSDKPPTAPYTLDYQVKMLDSLLRSMNVGRTDLVVHDLGGPVGLLWAVRNPSKVRGLVILNTFVHPGLSFLEKLVFLTVKIPIIRDWIASPAGISITMKWGVENKKKMTREVIAAYQAPFTTPMTRQVLIKTLAAIDVNEMEEIMQKLPGMDVPIRIIFGEKDLLLAEEMRRLAGELPKAQVTSIPDCGHFLQEDIPERLSELISEFLNK